MRFVDWRDVVKSTFALLEDLGSFPSTHLLSEQPSVTPGPEDLASSADLQRYQAHTYSKQNIHTHKIR